MALRLEQATTVLCTDVQPKDRKACTGVSHAMGQVTTVFLEAGTAIGRERMAKGVRDEISPCRWALYGIILLDFCIMAHSSFRIVSD